MVTPRTDGLTTKQRFSLLTLPKHYTEECHSLEVSKRSLTYWKGDTIKTLFGNLIFKPIPKYVSLTKVRHHRGKVRPSGTALFATR